MDLFVSLGGEFNTDMTWSVNSSTGEVKVLAKMPRGRKFHSMIAARGCIYCLGGQDKRGYSGACLLSN